MTGLGFDFLLLLWVAVSTLCLGVAICARVTTLNGIALLGYGAAAGVAIEGLFGLLIALNSHTRHFFALLLFICVIIAAFDLVRRGTWSRVNDDLTKPIRIALLLWLTFVVLCVSLVHVEVRWPEKLQQGTYIFQKHRLNTKVQHLTGLPADNYIPYTVTEFLLRGISFKEHHPILPGNEVSNRTILMSLVALPYRTVLGWSVPRTGELGTFPYVGRHFPDVESLNDDGSFGQFLVIGIFLNSLLLLGLLVFFAAQPGVQALPAAVLIFVTNSYFVGQTIFTWPKAMAGFFVVLAWDSLRRKRHVGVVALLTALAYHSHPSSIVAAVAIGMWVTYRSWRERAALRPALGPALQYAAVFLLMALPWIVWTKLVLALPSNMIWQNFAGAGTQAAMSSPLNFVWIRVANAFNTFAPTALGIYPFNSEFFASAVIGSLPFAVGLWLTIPAFQECAHLTRTEPLLLWFGLVIPAAVILLLYSCLAVPVLHGWQQIVGALLFFAVFRLRRTLSQRAFWALIVLQLATNAALLVTRARFTGVL